MDTRKNLIHIDDLFKELRNGEEQERSGAWTHMKELLDKEMPVGATVPGGRSFRRYIIPLAALLLLGGGASYYKLNTSDSKSKTPVQANHQVTNASRNALSGDVALSANNGSNNGNDEHKAISNTIAFNNNEDDNTNAARTGSKDHLTAKATKDNNTGNISDRTAAEHKRNEAQQQHSNAAANVARNTEKTGPASATTAKRRPDIAKATSTGASEAPARTKTTTTNNNTVAAHTEKEDAPKTAGNGLEYISSTLNNQKIVKDRNGNLYRENRDTFRRIDLLERTVANRGLGNKPVNAKRTVDTVAITSVEKVQYVPLTAMELIALKKMHVESNTRKLVPMANLKERVRKNEMVNLVPLANYKVSSRKVDPSKFNQLIQSTSMGLANYFDGSRDLYAAILVGGNTSFGNPNAFGMQLGIAALYNLGERLTLAAELKYVNHYYSNYSFEDKSVTVENISSQQTGPEWLFSGTEKTATSVYKINGFSALEMPITLSYNLGRVSLFAGVNAAYGFPINWNKETTVSAINVQKTNNQNQNPFLNSAFRIDEQKDFSSRFGLGYVWGISYDFSRKVSLDARISQILWDNNKGQTDAINRLFRTPTMQISFGYFFGRKDKVIYIMDKKK